jgi:hypothetical protein
MTEILDKKEISFFQYTTFQSKNHLTDHYFQFCVGIEQDIILLFDYKHIVYLYNYEKRELIHSCKMKKKNDDYKFIEFKHLIHLKNHKMIILMSTKGRLLPFVYDEDNMGFKDLLNLEHIGYDHYKCPITSLVKEKDIWEYNIYSKSSQGLREKKRYFNPYYIKQRNREIEQKLKKIQHQQANKILYDEYENKVIVFKKNCVFICGFSNNKELVLNKMHFFEDFENRIIDWNSVEFFGKFGNRKIIFNTIEEKSRNIFYRLESIL